MKKLMLALLIFPLLLTSCGGKGSILGTVVGALIIGVLNNGLVLLDVSPFWQQVVKGFVILLAVIMDRYSSKQ